MSFEPEALSAEPYCYLTTTGRVSGMPRTIEIWFALHGQTIYMLSGNGERANWVKNAWATPRVSIRIARSDYAAEVRRMRDEPEDALARQLLYEKYSVADAEAGAGFSLTEWSRTGLPVAFDVVLQET